jgi:hypothetical protein
MSRPLERVSHHLMFIESTRVNQQIECRESRKLGVMRIVHRTASLYPLTRLVVMIESSQKNKRG